MIALIKLQLKGFLSSLLLVKSNDTSKRRAAMQIIIPLLLLYCVGTFAVLFVSMFYMMGGALVGTEMAWLYWALLGVMCFALDFITTIFLAKKQLFEAEDNETLLALPVKPRDILLSRMVVILISNYFFTLLCAIPAMGVWGYLGGFTPISFILCLVSVLALPLLALSLAALVGWLLSLATARVKNKSLITLVFSLVFLGGYMAVMTNIEDILTQILTNADAVAEGIKSIFYPFYAFGMGANGSVVYTLLYLAMMLLPFVLTVWILSRTFLALATRQAVVSDGKAYTKRDQHMRSPRKALLIRELKRLSHSSTYMLNSGIGLLFLIVLAIGAPFLTKEFPAELGFITNHIGIIAITFCTSTLLFTAPSISLEGETLWQIKSLPLSGGEILRGKLDMHLVLTAPVILVASLSCVIFVAKGFLPILATILVPQALNLIFAEVGLYMNLVFPRFDWTNEAIVIKQSLSVGLTMLVTMTISAIVIGGGIALDLLLPAGVGYMLILIPLSTVGVLLYQHLTKHSDRMFAALHD